MKQLNNINPNSLLKYEGFCLAFETFMALPGTKYIQAYEMVEAIHERVFGFRRYEGGYDSFRKARYRNRLAKKRRE